MLENGQVEEAQKEKEKIEQMQRDARTDRQSRGEEWSPNFFEYVVNFLVVCFFLGMWLWSLHCLL